MTQVPCFILAGGIILRRFFKFHVSWTNTLQGNSFGIIPGGFQEAALTKLGTDRVWINSRKGFIKVRHVTWGLLRLTFTSCA